MKKTTSLILLAAIFAVIASGVSLSQESVEDTAPLEHEVIQAHGES